MDAATRRVLVEVARARDDGDQELYTLVVKFGRFGCVGWMAPEVLADHRDFGDGTGTKRFCVLRLETGRSRGGLRGQSGGQSGQSGQSVAGLNRKQRRALAASACAATAAGVQPQPQPQLLASTKSSGRPLKKPRLQPQPLALQLVQPQPQLLAQQVRQPQREA